MRDEPLRAPACPTSVRRKLLFALLPLLLLFALAETTARLLEVAGLYEPHRSITFIEANAFVRKALIPGSRMKRHGATIEVNSHGFRGPEFADPKPQGVFRIFAVGESSTFGWTGVQSHTQAWPHLLELALRERFPKTNVEIINAGIPGATSVEQRINLMLHISKLEPDALLIYHGNNDLAWSWRPDLDSKLIYAWESAAKRDRSKTPLSDHSYVLMELRWRYWRSEGRPGEKYDIPDPSALNMLKDNLDGLIADAKNLGLKVAIATFAHGIDENGEAGSYNEQEMALNVPQVGKWQPHLTAQGLRKSSPLYNQNVRELAARHKIPLLDLAKIIPATTEYHTDWCHLTKKGHQTVADAWADTIGETDWLTPFKAKRQEPVANLHVREKAAEQ
jgi:lysophospholipase L1-like esterase